MLHHTATQQQPIQKIIKSMRRTRGRVPAHYIIGPSGNFKKLQENEGYNVWATQSARFNLRSIQIEMVGNFEKHKPTKHQYEMLAQLKQRIEEKYWDLKIKLHKDISPTSCPGKYFDPNMINRKELLTFNISRYYSPQQGQERYYPWRSWWFLADKEINCWLESDCLNTASNTSLNKDMYWKIVACPKWIKFWTKIYLENYWVVTCLDRWGAIEKSGNVIDLDLRMWKGDIGLNNLLNSNYVNKKNWYIVNTNTK